MHDDKSVGAEIHQTANFIDNFISFYLHQKPDYYLTAIEGMTLTCILEKNGPLFAKDIMKVTKVSKATVSQTLSSLVEKKMIIMQEKEDDKRSKIIYITEKGRKTINQFQDIFADIARIIEKDITKEEKEQLSRIFEKIKNNIRLEGNYEKDN